MTGPWVHHRRACDAAARIALLTVLAGCSTFTVDAMLPWSAARKETLRPGRMAVSWTPEKKGAKVPWRGFRGKVEFFAQSKTNHPKGEKHPETPIQVDGILSVYAIDETNGVRTRVGPPRKFVFDAKQLKKLCQNAEKSPWYDIWIAYDTVGGPPKQLRLLTRFDAVENGPVIMSDDVRVQLAADPPLKPVK